MWDGSPSKTYDECGEVDGIPTRDYTPETACSLAWIVHFVARFCMGAERIRLAMIASSYYPTLVL